MSPRVVEFDWDDANIAHIARHDVVPAEVQEAFFDNDAFKLRRIAESQGIDVGDLTSKVFADYLHQAA